MIVDMHCDTIYNLRQLRRQKSVAAAGEAGSAVPAEEAALRDNTGHLDLTKMKNGGYLLQNFALFVEMSECTDPWEDVQDLYSIYDEEMGKNTDLIGRVLRYEDIEALKREGKMASLLTVEEGGVCKGEISKLMQLYDQGVRMMTLTWNFENEIGYPHTYCVPGARQTAGVQRQAGLKPQGIEIVECMQDMGMIVDVSHLSDDGFWDVWKLARKPFVASHSNAREICRSTRNMTDEMIRALAEKGGVMGLNYCIPFVSEQFWRAKDVSPNMLPFRGTDDYLMMLAQHAKHIENVGGIECLGLGSDFDGIKTHEALPHAGEMERLRDTMKKAGFTESRLDKIWYENVLRVYREVL